MSVNRLAELQSDNRGRQPSEKYEMRPLLGQGDINSLPGFLLEIDEVKKTIQQVNEDVNQIQSMQNNMLQTADASEMKRLGQQIDHLTQDTQKRMKQVKLKLKEIEPTPHQTDLAMRKNTFSSTTKSFIDVIERHRRVAINFQRAESDKLERQIKIANPNATPDEIEKAIASAEQGRPSVFSQQLIQSMNSEYRKANAQDTLDAVQERHEDIRRIAKSVQELSTLFEEMQTMLESQSKVLNSIESTTMETNNNLEAGVKEAGEAINTARSTRRKKWICFIIFVIILIIIAIVLAVVITNNKKNNTA
ncbi:t-SNARE [Pilobolus umbonatus]|nr:t-SNARE [Pilobolus umbonatus]